MPCSKRYAGERSYTIAADAPKGDWKRMLDGWDILRQWGVEERVHAEPLPGDKGHHALRVFYPEGSINPSNVDAPRGGAGFYTAFATPVKAACLKYNVYFPEEFAFARGGKLPGLYGGVDAAGCHADGGRTGFSTRYMWRDFGKGVLYAYLPGKTEECGQKIGLGNWNFARGAWTQMEQEVVLNTPGQEDGLIRVWANGKLVVEVPNAVIRETDDIQIDGLFFSTFFGGKDPSWASPKDQSATFTGFVVYFPSE